MEEKAADEDGGAGGEVPHVQDGADQGDAAQLPVVAGDWVSFHGLNCVTHFIISYKEQQR